MIRVLISALFTLSALCFAGCGTAPKTECESDTDCFESYACDVDTSTCLRACTTNTDTEDCLAGQSCDVPDGESSGVCRADG